MTRAGMAVGVFLLGAAAPVCSRADISSAENVEPVDLHSVRASELSVGFGMIQLDYAEDLPAPEKSTESGLIPQFELLYRNGSVYRGWYIQGRIDLGYASTRYDGTTMRDNRAVTLATPSSFSNFELTLGLHLLDPLPSVWLGAYTGLGYRDWTRGDGALPEDPKDPFAYKEQYSWLYAPIGVQLGWIPLKQCVIGLDGSLRPSFAGTMQLMLSDSFSNVNDPESKLGGTWGWRVAAPVSVALGREWLISATPWLEHSAIGEGSVFVATSHGTQLFKGYEPASSTRQMGLTLGTSLRL